MRRNLDETRTATTKPLRRSILLVAAAAAFAALILPGAAATDTGAKPFTANVCASGPCIPPVTPPTLSGGSSATIALTIDNQASPQPLGSANVTAPAGFAVTAVSPLPTGSSFAGRLIQLRNLDIVAGAPRTFTITVSVPCQPPADLAWAVAAKQSNNFNGPPGNNFTLVGPSSLTTNVSSGCKLVFVKQPASAQVGRVISSVAYDPTAAAVKVEVHDASDALITTATGSVTLTASSNASSFSGNATSLSGGVATFPSLQSSAAGAYTVTASATGYASSDASSSFKIGSKLVFLSQPQDAQAGVKITTADFDPSAASVQVAVVPPDDTSPYTPIASATGSATLTPSPTGSFTGTTASFSSVVATFSTLTGNATGTYTVTASSTGNTSSSASDPFAISDFGAICPAGDTTCTGGATSPDKKTSSSVTSTTTDGFPTSTTLAITMLASGPPTGLCTGFTPLAGSEGVAVDVRPLTDLTEVTIRLNKTIVNAKPDNGAAHFEVCFGGINVDSPTTPFTTKSGTPAVFDTGTGLFWGLLPNCPGTPTQPCVESRSKDKSGDVIVVFDVPNPWDLRGYTG